MAGPFTVTLDRTEEVMKAIRDAAKYQVVVGIPENSTRREGQADNALLGYVHEFGSPARNIPPRPFLVPSISQKQEVFAGMLEKALSFEMDGRPDLANDIFEQMGLKGVATVKNYMQNSGNFAPLAEATLQRRRTRASEPNTRDSPLRDTLQMFNAVTYVVAKK